MSAAGAGGDTRTGLSLAGVGVGEREMTALRISIGINLILLAACAWLWLARERRDAAGPGAVAWSDVAAGDYVTYVANLRAMRCPEETIRDIISADLASKGGPDGDREKGAASVDIHLPAPGVPSISASGSAGAVAPVTGRGASGLPTSNRQWPTPRASAVDGGVDRGEAGPGGRSIGAADRGALLARLLGPENSAGGAGGIGRESAGRASRADAGSGREGDGPGSADGAGAPGSLAAIDPSLTNPDPSLRVPRGWRLFTPEQEQMRAKLGWEAFYWSTEWVPDPGAQIPQGQ